MSIRLYVGNLPKEEVDRQELQAIFADAGDSITTKVIKDRKTGQCRGFAFVTVKTDEQADEIIEKFNGFMFKDTPLKIEKALPRAKNESDEEAPRLAPAASDKEKPRPVQAGNNASSGGGGGGSGSSSGGGGGSSRRRGGQKSRRTTTQVTGDPEAIQPDPRWASELAKLKELLAAQTTNP